MSAELERVEVPTAAQVLGYLRALDRRLAREQHWPRPDRTAIAMVVRLIERGVTPDDDA